ncbi:Phosphatidylglycerol--prolipoprotein diacylglyceryl transferase [Buchnera aphidicola (Pemphigus immunis)]
MNHIYIPFPNLNPIVFSIGKISLHWYGIMYLLGLFFALYIGKKKIKKNNKWTQEEIENLIYNCFFALLIGGKLGYIIFYNPSYYLNNINNIFKIWEGGMSFHGGFIGVIIAIFFFSKKTKKPFLQITDFIAPLVPFGLGAGRIGNFINGELWGRISTNMPLSMLFPGSKAIDLMLSDSNKELQILIQKFGLLPRHPSQIYEFFLEGVILFIILHWFSKIKTKEGTISAIFLISYGILRIIAEFFRQPDPQIGLLFGIITMGQILSCPMIIIGIAIIIKSYIKYI